MKRFSKFIQESIELKEQKMTFQDAEKLKNKHLAAMQHHKKSGNSKGYAAHSMVVDKFEDAYDRHGTGVIPVGRIMSASQKAFKDHPHSNMKEEVELYEDLNKIANDHDIAAKKHRTAFSQATSTAAARNHEVAYNRHTDAAKAHREAANDKGKHSSEKLEKMSNHAWDATDHIRKHFDESVKLDETTKKLTGGQRSAKMGAAMDPSERRIPKRGTKAYAAWMAKNDERRKAELEKWKNKNEEVELDEAVEVSHDRYMRSHGKKASGGEGNWMFTHKRMGDANVNDPKEVHSARGKFSDAKKSAQQWAKKNGHSTVYVMEEVELDEVSDKKLDVYRQKAFADQPSGDDGSDKYRKRKFGRDLAFAKQTGRAKVLATKEEVDLDEAAPKIKPDFIKIQREKDRAHDAAMGRTPTGRKKTMTSTQRSLASMRKEEAGLNEVKTDIYHKHMLKALGKTRLPKDHSYTSAIANNGDFVVKDGGGRTVGRIPKGEHNLKDK